MRAAVVSCCAVGCLCLCLCLRLLGCLVQLIEVLAHRRIALHTLALADDVVALGLVVGGLAMAFDG